MKTNLELSSERIYLRSLNRHDIIPLKDAISLGADTIGIWLDWSHKDFSETDARVWISNSRQNWSTDNRYELGIFDNETHELMGAVCVYSIDRVANLGNFGYWLTSKFQRKGYGLEAAEIMAKFAFDKLNITRLEIVINPQNKASRSIAERLSAHLECVARNRLMFNGKVSDGLLYSLIPSDLKPRNRTAAKQTVA